jgi:hypothetical protein
MVVVVKQPIRSEEHGVKQQQLMGKRYLVLQLLLSFLLLLLLIE